MTEPFANLPRGHYGAILADPPWEFRNLWNTPAGVGRGSASHYETLTQADICALRVGDVAATDAALFLWGVWSQLPEALEVVGKWGFSYKSCAFDWMKADVRQIDMFKENGNVQMGLGYWTRANSEFCLLGTRGKPKRLNADVRQGIIAPRREHSRKPDGIHERIERLVGGPYLELFARQKRAGWDVWGNQTNKFEAVA